MVEEMLEADRVDQTMGQVKALLQAGFKLKAGSFGLSKPTAQAAHDAQEEARRTIEQRRKDLEPVRAATRERFIAALRTYFLEPLPAGLAAEAREEIERLVRIISRLDTLTGSILSLRNEVVAFDLLLRNRPKDGSNSFYRTARSMGASIERENTRFLEATAGLEYPFDHARGRVLLCDFLVEAAGHSDESIHAFLRGQALLDRLLTVYFRSAGRLAQLALQVEQTAFAATSCSAVLAPTP
jgi:hypothetical protein